MPFLFSYGSNSPAQLAERLGRAFKGEAALVDGYLRVFRGWSDRWDGGVASLKKGKGTTYGWVAKVTAADLDQLDRFEGVASGKYKQVKVEAWSSVSLEVIAYVSRSKEFNEPSREYLEACARTVGAFWSGEVGKITWRDFPIR